MTKRNLRDRCIEFSILNIKIGKTLIEQEFSKSFGHQLIRSSASPALNYSEAKSAESHKDFHKLSIALKELRETLTCLEIIQKSKMYPEPDLLKTSFVECNELIAIFVKCMITAKRNSSRII